MRKLSVAGLVVAGSVAGGTAAHAVVLNTPVPYCITGGGFAACASATLSVSGSTLSVVLQNLSGTGMFGVNTFYKLTGFGFYYLPTDLGGSLAQASSPSASWVGLGRCLDGTPNVPAGCKEVIPGGVSGETWLGGSDYTGNLGPSGTYLDAGDTGTWTFSITGSPSWNNVRFAWRGQAWEDSEGDDVGEGSIKCFETGETANSLAGSVCGATVIPEPTSLLLLATGLVGLGGLGMLRRHRRYE